MDSKKDLDRPLKMNINRGTQGKPPGAQSEHKEERPTVTNASISDLFRRLNIDKLTRAHFLNITPNKELVSEKDLIPSFMQRLLTADYRARYLAIKPEPEANTPLPQHQHTDKKGGAFKALLSKMFVSVENKQDPVHPMDVQMAVYHCSDSFLKQMIGTKLSQCQYALPLLVPNPFTREIEFPLWTFRQIKKSWNCTDQSGEITNKTKPICEAETPMVAFFRLGSISSSKSQLINSLINDKHNTFFHRHCPGSSRSHLLMDGVVEIAWYCPSGKTTDHFTDCVAFCNLHGDSSINAIQRKILTETASVNVVFLAKLNDNKNDMEIVEKLSNSPTPLVVLLTDEEDEEENAVCISSPLGEGKYRMRTKGKDHLKVSTELRGLIKQCVSQWHGNLILENLTKYSEIKVDEKSELCQTAKCNAQQIVDLLRGGTPSQIKETHLPCQGNLWHEWCQKKKEMYRLHSDKTEAESSAKRTEMRGIRSKQHSLGFSKLMNVFVSNLTSSTPKGKVYFLEWVRRMLDEFTSEVISNVIQENNNKWTEVSALKNHHEKQKLQIEQKDLESISEKLNTTTFGLEHLLREMGQIYEASASLSVNKKTDLTYLAALAADLMILGYPLELMDGDASHVPVVWVSAVLDEVIKKLGDQRVFVLSVLGIQSSGKSTLLNAMFGLQFAVRRCTRGAFMHLVKVSEEMKTLKFNYILVVDTKGLRALELVDISTRHHDNELSTFVVGLGNLTLINIFGEDPAEMQDILQIVVQTFLRMKKVRMNPSCMFVHQNVGDITAEEKTMEGKRRLQEKLDEMTKLAVKDEASEAEYFNDIIAFDVRKDVRYFAQLWEGNPPMAPPNPAYCDNVRELKETILEHGNSKTCSTLSDFKDHIKSLWHALLNENFVFSFKNTLEISVYRKLEEQYVTWTWTLRTAMLTVQEKYHTKIKNMQIHKVQSTELVEEMSDTFKRVQNAMNSYFEEEEYEKEILKQWKAKFTQKITDLHNDFIKQAIIEIGDIISHQEACKKLDEQKTMYENKLIEKSKELALNFQSKINNENEMKRQFDSVWEKWVSDLSKGNLDIEKNDINEDIFRYLCEMHDTQLVHDRLRNFKKTIAETGKFYNEINMTGDYSNYVILRNCKYNVGFTLKIRELEHRAIRETENLVNLKPVAKSGYKSSYIQEIVILVTKLVSNHRSEHYELKKEFTVDLSLHVCERARERFSDLHQQYRNSYDPLIYLENMKPAYYSVFQNFCKCSSSTATCSILLCSKLEEKIMQSVYNRITKYLSDEMRTNIPAFKGNRLNLEKYILKSLAEEEEFEKFQTYIRNPREHSENFIKETVENYMKEENPRALEHIRGIIAHKQQCVITAAETATEEVTKKSGDGNMWLEIFSDRLKDELEFNKEHLSSLQCSYIQDVSDFGLLKDVLKKEIPITTKHLSDKITSLNDLKIEKFTKRPDEILIDHLCRCCWAQCPFCNAICTNTMEDHVGDHSAPFHRPDGIIGWHTRGTTDLSSQFCTTAVASKKGFYPSKDSEVSTPYKEYRNAGGKYATWSITPDLSELPYWKWFVCRFQEELEKYYNKTFSGKGQIPDEWREYTVHDAIASLDEYI